MALHKVVIVIFLACMIKSCYAYQFYVGGRDGWVLNPSENYNHWAERMRFQVNDTLVFKYKKGSNSVLVVNKDDYDKCNTNNPIIKMDDGNSIFKFDHSGPFFFISGNQSYCQNGSQKLITVVLAIRPPPPSPATPPATPPATSPSVSPATPPMSQTPTLSPATSPTSETPTPSPQATPPMSQTPSLSPATSPTSETPTPSPQNAPTPATSPANSPAPSTGTPSTSPAPAATPPSGEKISPSPSSTPPSSSSPPGSPGNSPPGSISPASPGGGNSPPADIQAPTGSKNSAGKVFTTVSAVFVSIIFNIIIISA